MDIHHLLEIKRKNQDILQDKETNFDTIHRDFQRNFHLDMVNIRYVVDENYLKWNLLITWPININDINILWKQHFLFTHLYECQWNQPLYRLHSLGKTKNLSMIHRCFYQLSKSNDWHGEKRQFDLIFIEIDTIWYILDVNVKSTISAVCLTRLSIPAVASNWFIFLIFLKY